MQEDRFGNIVTNGKMVDIDNAKISDLEKIASDLREKEKELKKKTITVFKQ